MKKLIAVSVGLLIAYSLPARADARDFDRFFSNAHTRESLDEARTKFSVSSAIPSANDDEESPQQRAVQLNGVVIRSGGASQVWINNQSQLSPRGPVDAATVQKNTGGTPQVAVTVSGSKVIMKPGEVYSLETGVIREAYEQRQLNAPADLAAQQPQPEAEDEEAGESVEFDESKLAEQDTRIQLLEEKLEKLESSLNKEQPAQVIKLSR